MLNALSGTLLSHYFAERLLADVFAGELGEASSTAAFQQFRQWWKEHASQLGPASSVRAVLEHAVLPLAEALGFGIVDGRLLLCRETHVALLVGLWTDSLDTLWRKSVHAGLNAASQWCFCCNGHELRLVDTEHTYSRAHLQFDLERTADDARTFAVLWGVLRAEAFHAASGQVPLVNRIIMESARHGASVGQSLRIGVIDSVAQLLSGLLENKVRNRRPTDLDLQAGLDESLTLIYRVLFLMFAEARGLVPHWHPIYRDHYTIDALRNAVERPAGAKGLWETLQAISRMAHRGCRAGTLSVPAFNGRLFSPARSPMVENGTVANDTIRNALVSLSTAPCDESRGGAGPRARIDYRDLGVEQLGAVYETVLEYEPAFIPDGAPKTRFVLRRGGDLRKATGSFYTPQSITDYVVRRTLHPLIANASSQQILRLRIVDPSMGSAAFLVAACRYLAGPYERALLREGECHEGDIGERERAAFRRLIAQRCLFGVDLNPTAVQLARLSLWLATLASGKPLSFFDHHLLCGDSLIGASPADIARQPPPRLGGRASVAKNVHTPLFADPDLEPAVAAAVLARTWIAEVADDSVEIVRQKEQRLERLHSMNRWKEVADLWCASWMWPPDETSPGGAMFASLRDQLVIGRATLPAKITEPLLKRSRTIAERQRFLHWPLEFPEVYFDSRGEALENPGFDAVLGNPPWHMLRRESAEKALIRGSGIYRHQGAGHINRYQLFVERAIALTKRGGRIGLVVPSGFATDHTSSALRRHLLDHCETDTLAGFDNRRAIFPIHRSVRFVLFTATTGRSTTMIKCRFGIDDPAFLDSVPDTGDRIDTPAYSIALTPAFITRLAGEHMTIPELRSPLDLAILERIVDRFPRMADKEGWNAEFGRELNATDDRSHFFSGPSVPRHHMPVLEGKHIEPFIAHTDQSTQSIAESTAASLIDPARSFRRARLAYRDVASATNRLSLIAAILPRGVITTHSLFCLKTLLEEDEQAYLCGILNSFVANYLVRLVMTTHLGSTTVEHLRVPKLARGSIAFQEISSLARTLSQSHSASEGARLQAIAAHAYQLTLKEFGHVLTTFPLVPQSDRAAALDAFSSWSETCEFA